MFIIKKTIEFCSSHKLDGLPEGHPCARLHGHNYVVEFELASDELDDTGFVLDTNVLKALKELLDHRHLNDVMLDENKKPINPTSENTARWLGSKVHDLLVRLGMMADVAVLSVSVRETPSTIATWLPHRTVEGFKRGLAG